MKILTNYWALRAVCSAYLFLFLAATQGVFGDIPPIVQILLLVLMAPTFAWTSYEESLRSTKSTLSKIAEKTTPWILTAYLLTQIFIGSMGPFILSRLLGSQTSEIHPIFYKSLQIRFGLAFFITLIISLILTICFVSMYRSKLKSGGSIKLFSLTFFTMLITFGITGSLRVL